jgi:hypothetical protein
MIENLSYFIHTICHKDIIYSIKYFSRFLQACQIFNYRFGKQNSNDALITYLTQLTMKIKSLIRNRMESEIIENAKHFPFLVNQNNLTSANIVEKLKNEVLDKTHELSSNIFKNEKETDVYVKTLLELLLTYINNDNSFITIKKEGNKYIFRL